jgi:hypothetical protein
VQIPDARLLWAFYAKRAGFRTPCSFLLSITRILPICTSFSSHEDAGIPSTFETLLQLDAECVAAKCQYTTYVTKSHSPSAEADLVTARWSTDETRAAKRTTSAAHVPTPRCFARALDDPNRKIHLGRWGKLLAMFVTFRRLAECVAGDVTLNLCSCPGAVCWACYGREEHIESCDRRVSWTVRVSSSDVVMSSEMEG